MFRKIKWKIDRVIRPNGKISFINSIIKNGKVLDVGCGNNSPFMVKSLRPDFYYTGLDIGIYNQTADYTRFADEIILTEPENFQFKIEEHPNTYDSIICSQNLEHCNDYMGVTLAMVKALIKGGTIYLSFPCEESIHFPRRNGCLNFYDDPTHKNLIPYQAFISLLTQNGMEICFTSKRYRPLIPFLIGFLLEPFCKISNRLAILGSSWAFYGFETIIVAQKKA